MTELTVYEQQRRFYAGLAFLFAVGLHGILIIAFFSIRMHSFVIPYAKKKNPIPFILKRVEMNASYLQTAPGPSPSAITAAQNQNAIAPSQRELGAEVFNKASSSLRPQVDLPPASETAVPPVAPDVAATPFNLSDAAEIQAEVRKLEVGATAPPLAGGGNADLPGAALGQLGGEGTPTGAGATPGSGGGSVKAPSFSEVAPRLKAPDAGLNPKLPEPVILRLPSDVVFDFDSATLRPEAVPLLELAADWIAKYAVARIQVAGHTDTFGTDTYNQKLSENRALSVEKWMQQKLGSEKYTFEAKGYGKSHPLVNPKGTIKEQEANRRVEIMIQAINP